MSISKIQIKNILDTLPTGYYLGRQIDVLFDEDSDSSYIDFTANEIHVAYQQLAPMLDKIDEDDAEYAARCMLYHEVSHALLTPKKMPINDIMNIFEDERIETLLADLFIGIDFKKFVKELNDYHGEAPTSALNEFYQVVRYRVGELRFLDQVVSIIADNATLNYHSECWSGYRNSVTKLYKEICDKWTKAEKLHPQDTNADTNDDDDFEFEATQSVDDTVFEEHIKANNDIIAKRKIFVIDRVRDKFAVNEAFLSKVDMILRNITKSSKQNGSAINSYSGVFDPRAVARNDYKYFVQKNRSGHTKHFSKFHLNLFIDNSGSFTGDAQKVNELLFALAQFEKKNHDFEFDVITMNTRIVEKEKNDRYIICTDCNTIPSRIFDIIRRHKVPNASVYNIVLFDGDCYSAGFRGDVQAKNHRAFDIPNCTIISDRDNFKIFNKMKSAHVIFTDKYVDELEDSLIKALQRFTR